jgi:hypothetical protein
MSSAAAQYPNALPDPPVFKPKNNPGFILHGKLETSFEEVSTIVCYENPADLVATCTGGRPG